MVGGGGSEPPTVDKPLDFVGDPTLLLRLDDRLVVICGG